MQNNAFTLSHVTQAFPNGEHYHRTALKDINLCIEKGSFVSIVGPSGCGKSTVLRILAGLIPPTTGNMEREVENLGMVFQNFALFPWLSVCENVEFGLKMKGIEKHERERIVRDKIREVGLKGYEHKIPHDLSGGMRQRVGFARALAITPDALLLDEPFSALDPFTAEVLKQELFAIWRRYKMTVVMVTHTVEDAVELSQKIIMMSKHPGEILEELPVHMDYPRNLRSEKAFALVDHIKAKIQGKQSDFAR